MKAAWQHKREWEEDNLLRLIILSKKFSRLSYFLLKKISLFASIVIFIAYVAIKLIFELILTLLASEPAIRPVKEETWMFQQLK